MTNNKRLSANKPLENEPTGELFNDLPADLADELSDELAVDESAEGDFVYALAAAPGWVPGQRGTVFAARASGLYRSDDGGQTWLDALAALPLSEPMPVLALALSPNFTRDGSALAGVPGGVFRTSDGGQTWRAVVLPDPPPIVTALVAYAISSVETTVVKKTAEVEDPLFFAGTMEDGVFTSHDAGGCWAAWNFGLLDLNVLSLALSPSYAEDEIIFAGTETGLFRSTNGGRAWRDLDLPFGFDAVASLAVSPHFGEDATLYLGAEVNGLWRSTDAGETWQPLGHFEDPINSLAVGASGLLAVTVEGLWLSTDGGQTWSNRLDESESERGISAVLVGEGDKAMVGFMDGSVTVVDLG